MLKYILLFLVLFQNSESCLTRYKSKPKPSDLNTIVIVGGKKQLNQTHFTWSDKVEVLSPKGICKVHKLSLPFPICHHQAVVLPVSSQILVCGWKHKDEKCTHSIKDEWNANIDIKDDYVCLVWAKGDAQFHELSHWVSRLPELTAVKNPRFDFHQNFNDTIYLRSWGSKELWKGRISQGQSIVWERRAQIPLNTESGCSIMHRGSLVTIGGRWINADIKPKYTSSVYKYLETNNDKEIGWKALPSMDKAIYGMTCLSLHERGILVLGGQTQNESVPIEAEKMLRFYNGYSGTWSFNSEKWTPFKRPRIGAGAAMILNKAGQNVIVVFGGYDPYTFDRLPQFLDNFETYNEEDSAWTNAAWIMSEPKSDMAVVNIPSNWIPDC